MQLTKPSYLTYVFDFAGNEAQVAVVVVVVVIIVVVIVVLIAIAS